MMVHPSGSPGARPSLVLPVAMIAGGSVMSLGGTALSLFGLAVASLRPHCRAPGACDGHLYAGGSMIAGGVRLLAGGLVLAILGHVKWTTRVERWAAATALAALPVDRAGAASSWNR